LGAAGAAKLAGKVRQRAIPQLAVARSNDNSELITGFKTTRESKIRMFCMAAIR